MNKLLKVKCPTCEKKFNYTQSDFRPFCSERCQMVDLGHWLDGSYSIASKEQLEEEDLEKVVNQNMEDSED